MLQELKVRDFAIIENVHLVFRDGLNVLSGETGAGKSVLLKSLALLMGGKASVETIRTGAAQAVIEGSFDISRRPDILQRMKELGLDVEDKLLVVRRILSAGDRSRIYLNGSVSTLNTLRDLVSPLIEVTGPAAPLIEMTGQHENRNLMSKHYHLELLDQYAGVWERRLKYEELWRERQQVRERIQELEVLAKTGAQRLDFLIFQRDEIQRLDLSPGEDLEIEQNVKRLKNASRLSSFVEGAEGALYEQDDSAVSRIKSVLKRGAELASVDPVLHGKLQGLEQAVRLIDDTVYELRQHLGHIDSDPGRLEELESRLSDLRKLQKKFGPGVDDILRSLIGIESEIAELQNAESKIAELRARDEALVRELRSIGQTMHQRREKGARLLADSVNGELVELNMKGVSFEIQTKLLEDLNSTGLSDVEFMTRNGPKDPPRPLAKAASGGELSRILLSLKRVVGSSERPRTYLFDEVDTGVSGPTAEKVGRKLRSIAKGQQVICVTHLPQVAACGDVHFFIQKAPGKDSVSMDVHELKASQRAKEIARLISGEKITKTSLAHAEQLLAEGRA